MLVAASASVNFDIKWKVRRAAKGGTFAKYACSGARTVILDGTVEKKLALQPKGGVAPSKRARRWDASDLWRELGQSYRL